jgi:glycosyltransferase involved in cell wall biosynthesis
MKVLIITRLFPNACEPLWAPFNRQQFAALSRLCEVEVLGTIPWFPGARAVKRWSAAGRLAGVPREESIAGVHVRHPRYLLLPKIGHAIAWQLYAASVAPLVLGYRRRVDVVLGSWAYPDGCAAVALARLLRVPAVVKLHGSDLNVVAALRGPRRSLLRILPRAHRVVAVSRPLADQAAALGVPRERISLVPNGVDETLFHPRDRHAARAALGPPDDRGRWIVCVGRLERSKGVLDLIDAFGRMSDPEAKLFLVGDGAARGECERAVARFGARATVVGPRPLEAVPTWMAAADVVALPSWNEGTPNALLEALACGRRVVATRVGGVPDVLTSDRLGELVEPQQPAALAEALSRALRTPYDAAIVASSVAGRGWNESASRLRDVLEEATRAAA